MPDEKRYDIGGVLYVQRRLVLGQVRQLLDILRDLTIPGNIDAAGLMMALGSRLPKALAVVLTPEGVQPRDKNLDLLAEEIEFLIETEQALEVIEDFFHLNPLPSIFERIAGMEKALGSAMRETLSRNSASSFPGETSPGATESSGA